MPVDLERLESIRQSVAIGYAEVNAILYGKKVRFRGWKTGGVSRTGTIISAIPRSYRSKKKLGIGIGVHVDRADGGPGVLADPWYGDLNAVEIIE